MKSKCLLTILCWTLASFLLVVATACAEDVVEFLNGATVRGKILEIRKDKKEFDFQVQVGGRTLTRTYSYDKVHAVTFDGMRHVLTEKSASDGKIRSREEVKRYIEESGKKPPDWFEAEPLDYPESLDLSWPLKPADEGWDNQKNVGQYIWDIVNPNPPRWQSGIKLVHHVISGHRSDAALLRRDMETLGTMYFQLFQDYGRAAYWLQRHKPRRARWMEAVGGMLLEIGQ